MNNFKSIFNFNRSERIGSLVLVILIVIIIAINLIVDKIAYKTTVDKSQFKDKLEEFERTLVYIQDEKKYASDKKIIERYKSIELFDFDPNSTDSLTFAKLGFTDYQIKTLLNYRNKGGKFFDTKDLAKIYGISNTQFEILLPYIKIENRSLKSDNQTDKGERITLFEFNPNKVSPSELIALGLSEKQANTIINYRNSGGIFKRKEDFAKIYGISKEMYETLSPYIMIDTTIFTKKPKVIQEVELNTATAEQLSQLNGISFGMANRIINYRTILGGYFSVEQLLEVYEFDASILKDISPYIKINVSSLKTININFADAKELSKHKYLDYATAKTIVDFRSKNGSFKSVDDLRKYNVIESTIFEKVKYYLSVK